MYRFVIMALIILLMALATTLREEEYTLDQNALYSDLTDYYSRDLFYEFELAWPEGARILGPFESNLQQLEYYLAASAQNASHHLKREIGLSINAPPSNKNINIYFIDDKNDPDKLLKIYSVGENCGALPFGQVILCSKKFIDFITGNDEESKKLQAEHEEVGSGIEEDTLANMRMLSSSNAQLSIMWVLGHEIGHLAHRHSTYTPENESTADEFAIEVLTLFVEEVQPFIANTFKMTSGSVASSESVRLLGKPWFKHEGEIEVKKIGKHPPLFIRAMRIAGELSKAYKLESINGDYDKNMYFLALERTKVIQ